MTRNILLAAGAAAVLAAFVAAYFIFGGDSSPPLSENTLTLEQQSPRVRQTETKPAQQDETPEESRIQEQTAEEEPEKEQSVQMDDSGGAAQQPEDIQIQAEDPLTAELKDGVNEFLEFGEQLVERFPNFPPALIMSGAFEEIGETLIAYDAQLSRQGLSREDRIAKLKEKAESEGKQIRTKAQAAFTSGAVDVEALRNNPDIMRVGRDFGTYLQQNMPTKLMNLLGMSGM